MPLTAGESRTTNDVARGRIIPAPPVADDDQLISPDVWGFRDTAFTILPNGNVTLTGSRYALSGSELPDLLPWMKHAIGVEIPFTDTHDSQFPPPVPAPVEHAAFLCGVQKALPANAVTADPLVRLRHGHGHTLEAMYAIKYGQVERVPDLVVFPESVEHVTALVALATQHDVCLVPYGGGTNVTDALRCPADEQRMIVSVDLRRLNRILWIDPVNQMACIQAGAVGRHIQA